ncbi:hypothetical protein BGHDH14_bghG001246000001001 [Blumeria hordei DH14]|uniref:Uncharacterized protein n=1 Tax=Blumeria graminis f. sp. hordei (strain DH14) TaxID=546991 RepID=N1JC26_BLUG1|nr:hypothetical protein BGHDH14_bghG001246000001001 [Blumeria hordei DH14]
MPHSVRKYLKKSCSNPVANSRWNSDSRSSETPSPQATHLGLLSSHQHAVNRLFCTSDYDHASPLTSTCSRSSTDTYADSDANYEETGKPQTSKLLEPASLPSCRKLPRPNLRPSSPSDFADYFPSTRIMSICHDDTSGDSMTNIRVDTDDLEHQGAIQLFHLRIQDIENRKFSFRRYERYSGREICKTSQKCLPPGPVRRAVLPRSVSLALANMRLTSASFSSQASTTRHHFTPQHDAHPLDSDRGQDPSDLDSLSSEVEEKQALFLPDVIRLDFSNYAQVEIKCRPVKYGRRYGFEYWGQEYAWKRIGRPDALDENIFYHLFRYSDSKIIAHILPQVRSDRERSKDREMGDWVPPCQLWINDAAVAQGAGDVADVIVATGLVALVDDSIKSYSLEASDPERKSSRHRLRFGNLRKRSPAFRRSGSRRGICLGGKISGESHTWEGQCG